MFKKTCYALLTAFVALATQGCVSVLPTKPIYDFHSQYLDMLKGAKSNVERMNAIYQGATKASSSPTADPYPALQASLVEMRSAYSEIKAPADKEWSVMQGFQKRANGRSEMHSDWPEWPAVMQDFEYYKALLPRLQPQVERLNKAQGRFGELCNAHGVGEVETAAMREQLKGSMAKIDATTADTRAKIAKAREMIAQHTAATLGLAQHNKEKAALDAMDAILGRLEAYRGPLKATIDAFLAKDLPAKFYRGPGIPRVEAVEAMDQAGQKVNGLIDQFNAEAAKLNSK